MGVSQTQRAGWLWSQPRLVGVLGVAEVQFMFPTAALAGLCSVLGVTQVPVTLSALAPAEQCSHSISAVSPTFPSPSGAGEWQDAGSAPGS